MSLNMHMRLPTIVFSRLASRLCRDGVICEARGFRSGIEAFYVGPCNVIMGRGAGNVIATGNRDCRSPSGRARGAGFTLLMTGRFSRPFGSDGKCNRDVTHLSGVLNNNIVMRHFNSLIHKEEDAITHVRRNVMQPALTTAPNSLDLILPGHVLSKVVRVVCTLSGVTPKATGSSALLCNIRIGFCGVRISVSRGLRDECGNLCVVKSKDNMARSLSRTSTDNMCMTHRVIRGLWGAKFLLVSASGCDGRWPWDPRLSLAIRASESLFVVFSNVPSVCPFPSIRVGHDARVHVLPRIST